VPIYEYQCPKCQHIHERIYFNVDSPKTAICTQCGGKSKKIISAGYIHTDTPTWLDQNVRNAVQGDDERPIQNRKDLAGVMAKKKIEPIEKHINPHGTF